MRGMTATPAASLTGSAAAPEADRSRTIGPLGTIARAAVGVALLTIGVIAGGQWIA